MIECNKCNNKIEYDEGVGNLEDGYTCYECLEGEQSQIKVRQGGLEFDRG